MLDIVRIRNNPKEIEDALRKRMDNISLDEVLMWDEEKRKIGTERDELKNQKNIISKKIPILKKENVNVNKELEEIELLGDKILILSDKYDELDEKIKDFMDGLPNIPDDDVIGGGKENNKVIKTFKEKPKFNFKPKDHTTLATDLELIDYERGVKLGGQGSWIYTGVGAQLEWALLNYFINEHLKDKWQFMLVPHMLKYECGYAAGQFPKFKDEVYWLDGEYKKDGKFMLPTAETALVNVHRGEILKEEELPKKYIHLINGIFEDENYNIVSKEQTIDILSTANNITIKPSMASYGGKGVKFLDNPSRIDLVNFIDNLKEDNLIFQETVNQSDITAKLHPDSLNTIRIMTLILDGEVKVLPYAAFRMGIGKSKVDNASSGGIYCKINEDGTLSNFAYDALGKKFEEHPDGGKFSTIKFEFMEEVRELVKNAAQRFPHFRLIGWDIAITENNVPMIIEANLTMSGMDVIETICGPLFGEYTEKVLEEVFLKKHKKKISMDISQYV